MSLDSICNNHDIAISISKLAERKFNREFHHSITIFSADKIESRTFVDTMILLLYLESTSDWYSFADEIFPYTNRPMSEIKDCESIFNKFKKLIGE